MDIEAVAPGAKCTRSRAAARSGRSAGSRAAVRRATQGRVPATRRIRGARERGVVPRQDDARVRMAVGDDPGDRERVAFPVARSVPIARRTRPAPLPIASVRSQPRAAARDPLSRGYNPRLSRAVSDASNAHRDPCSHRRPRCAGAATAFGDRPRLGARRPFQRPDPRRDNPDERIEPASLTKLMTAYLVFAALKQKTLKLDQIVPVSARAWKSAGSRMFIEPKQAGHRRRAAARA